MEQTQIAKVCHEANRAYCETIGDNSQVPWDDAPEWQKQSAINGVNAFLNGEISLPWEAHERWVADKILDGWTYGPVKDPDKKEHPCMVPYSQLPEEQKVKDAIFRGIVLAFMRTVNS